jgi:LmbE family N-acetylglucosaminyl deacetylase
MLRFGQLRQQRFYALPLFIAQERLRLSAHRVLACDDRKPQVAPIGNPCFGIMKPVRESLNLLAVIAHPDDEGSSSGCLRKYAEQGMGVYVACATRGDGVDAQIKDPSLATRETLGQVRAGELACACQALGIQPPLFLGHQDGEVDQVPPAQAAQALARIMRQVRPVIVITHGPEGGYGHPDHIAVSRFTTLAVELASGEVELEPPPFEVSKLYYTATPRSFLEKVPAFRDRRADIRGKQLGFVGVEDSTITTEVDIRPWMRVKMQALSCHRTQFEFDPETGHPKTFAAGLPEEQRLAFFGAERFVLARSRAHSNGKETDLLEGLQ